MTNGFHALSPGLHITHGSSTRGQNGLLPHVLASLSDQRRFLTSTLSLRSLRGRGMWLTEGVWRETAGCWQGRYLHKGSCGSGLSGASSSCPHSPGGTCRNSHWPDCSTGPHSGRGWAHSNLCPAASVRSRTKVSLFRTLGTDPSPPSIHSPVRRDTVCVCAPGTKKPGKHSEGRVGDSGK